MILSFSCKKAKDLNATSEIIKLNDLTIETMKTDGINPVLSTRIYLYPNISAYEVIANGSNELTSLTNTVKSLEKIPPPENSINTDLAALSAYYYSMIKLNYREDIFTTHFNKLLSKYQQSLSPKIYANSLDYGVKVSNLIMDWADEDNYKQTKGMSYFINIDSDGVNWVPTPPEFRAALEPHWGKLRKVIVSVDFSKKFDIPYSEDTESAFYKMAREVYDSSLVLSHEQKDIALFWDDNPDLNNFKGHIPIHRRHINPTAHWFGIIGQALRKENLDFPKTVEIYSMAAISFYDANIICWENKFSSNLVRPVTYIQRNIDSKWMPLLVTPPFPEYTSGHSACSAACATVLTHFFGENYSFSDSTHFNSGLGVRSYSSLMEAAYEVSISRFYGGIHYKKGAFDGTDQGVEVGNFIINSLINDRH